MEKPAPTNPNNPELMVDMLAGRLCAETGTMEASYRLLAVRYLTEFQNHVALSPPPPIVISFIGDEELEQYIASNAPNAVIQYAMRRRAQDVGWYVFDGNTSKEWSGPCTTRGRAIKAAVEALVAAKMEAKAA